jgi:hypothetical protein
MDLNDLYEEVWNVGALLQTDEWPAVQYWTTGLDPGLG